jgi:hypothetical protein
MPWRWHGEMVIEYASLKCERGFESWELIHWNIVNIRTYMPSSPGHKNYLKSEPFLE